MDNELSGSEAVYGLLAWLTTRESQVTLGAGNDCAIAAELVGEFCKANKLAEPRDDWHTKLIHPKC